MPRATPIRPISLLLAAVMLAACGSAPPSTTGPTPAGSSSSPSGKTSPSSPTASPSPSATPTATATAQADCPSRTLASLSEAQRVGQLFMIGLIHDQLDGTERDAIRRAHLGSMLFTAKTKVGVAGVRSVTDAVQAMTDAETTGSVGFLIAANQEGGRIQSLAGPGFHTIPSAVAQGELTPAALRTNAVRWGAELASAGVNVDLAPVADVVPPGTEATNAPIGQLEREYGGDPTAVAAHVSAFVAGLADSGVTTTLKHFPGLGRVEGNTDFTADVVDDVTTRDDRFLDPFRAGIEAGVPFVMVSLATYRRIDPDRLAVFSPTIIGDVLRGDLRFDGVVVSDALGAEAVASIPVGRRGVDFVAAGGDLIIVNQSADALAMASALTDRAGTDPGFRQRIDDAALHVLRAKGALGLLHCS